MARRMSGPFEAQLILGEQERVNYKERAGKKGTGEGGRLTGKHDPALAQPIIIKGVQAPQVL
jgi:hypothetical protein